MTPVKIVMGQYIGFTAIVIISMIGFGVSLVLPSEPIGFLGLLPILLGIWKFVDLLIPQVDEKPEKSSIDGLKSMLSVAIITLMNGGDNIGTYIPLFSQAQGAEVAIYVVVYYILLGIWCLVAFVVMKQKHILFVAQKYADVVVPFLYVGLGIYILIKSSCYPWSIEHIDNATSKHIGQTVMAVVTTFLLAASIGTMLWFRLRKKSGQRSPEIGSVPVESSTTSGREESTTEEVVTGSATTSITETPP
jgi:cadmium resistance protein CadD (predicted permease)